MLTAASLMEPSPYPPGPSRCSCPDATPQTPIAELAALGARVPHPITVRGETGEVVGVVPQSRLLAALGDERPEEADSIACGWVPGEHKEAADA